MKKSWSHREVCLGRVGSGRNFRVLSSAEPAFAAERLAIVAALERSHFWFVARRGLIERLLRRFTPPSGTMAIDVGSGTGSFADGLARSGFRVLALDVRPEGLRRLRETDSPAWAAMGLCTDLPVAAGAADIVLTFDVLEHTDDEVSLGEIARVLRPGGIVVITVPAMPWLWSSRDEDAGHLRRYSRRGLLSLVERAGLEPLDVRFYQFLLLPLLLATRVAGRRWSESQRVEEEPSRWLNRLLLTISTIEVAMSDVIPWPAGSSLAAVGRKPLRS